ncbi:hypothetical protein D1BOALGB6SA_10323 [Olavius sp. associated proteobacterium Delta 1]|nr:hypothetical protein D1BOALGB6SA_10323 [Olavius sp. associated proteobacterium Delta 1]
MVQKTSSLGSADQTIAQSVEQRLKRWKYEPEKLEWENDQERWILQQCERSVHKVYRRYRRPFRGLPWRRIRDHYKDRIMISGNLAFGFVLNASRVICSMGLALSYPSGRLPGGLTKQ